MATLIVVGLFESAGSARDVCNRLHTEGVPEANCAHMALKEIVLVPSTSGPGLTVLSIDAMVFGNIRDKFARFIHNGETAVLVRAETETEAAYATDVLRLFTPIAIEMFDFEPAR
jgi:hypothetical protein